MSGIIYRCKEEMFHLLFVVEEKLAFRDCYTQTFEFGLVRDERGLERNVGFKFRAKYVYRIIGSSAWIILSE